MIEPLTISQVAQRAGIRTSTIRYYEQIDLLPIARRINGRRRYDPSILERLAFIQVTQNLGFTLGEIQRLFHHPCRSVCPFDQHRPVGNASRKVMEYRRFIYGNMSGSPQINQQRLTLFNIDH